MIKDLPHFNSIHHPPSTHEEMKQSQWYMLVEQEQDQHCQLRRFPSINSTPFLVHTQYRLCIDSTFKSNIRSVRPFNVKAGTITITVLIVLVAVAVTCRWLVIHASGLRTVRLEATHYPHACIQQRDVLSHLCVFHVIFGKGKRTNKQRKKERKKKRVVEEKEPRFLGEE